jgi:hypothetical protein
MAHHHLGIEQARGLRILGVVAQRVRGKNHHAALRALGNRWLEILWHCLIRGQLYDEAIHTANRNRALAKAA